MTLSLGFRPRSDAERLRLAQVVREAPERVALGFEDDGFVAAVLRIAGRVPVWASPGDRARCDALLARLGLPPVDDGGADATLLEDLSFAPGSRPLPPAPGRALREAPVSPRTPGDPRPLVTILVCTFERAHLIREALASALAQTWPCEVLVVDDGSRDATPEILASVDGLRVLRQEPNQGKPRALARGVAEARGEAILVLDDDDLLLPGSVAVLAHALFSRPELVAVWADTVVFDGATGTPASVRTCCRWPGSMARRATLVTVPAMPGATLVRTTAWRAVGPGDPSLVRGQDMDLFLSLAGLGPIEAVPLPTFFYREHDALRGSAAGQWRKSDPVAHRRRFLSFVKPVFERRYLEHSPVTDRAEGHAWALGLWQRELTARARQELDRWPGPWSEAEAWVREQLGRRTRARHAPGVLVVVDDGDEGALEQALFVHARGQRLYVDLEVPRDPLGQVRLAWPGTYGAREPLAGFVRAPGPWTVVLTSAAEHPITLDDPRLLPDRVPASEAVSAVAAVLAVPWARTRPGLGLVDGRVSSAAWRARGALQRGRADVAMGVLEPLLAERSDWPGAWRLLGEAFAALGLDAEAATCRRRAGGAPARSPESAVRVPRS